MAANYVLSDYIDRALADSDYDKPEDGTFAGRIDACPGAVAFGPTLPACSADLRSTLAEWIELGIELGHALPVIGGIDLTDDPAS